MLSYFFTFFLSTKDTKGTEKTMCFLSTKDTEDTEKRF